ncbi:MAG: hypothetical protein NTV22_05760 [bacterium]|nr:hypothetical protein [bacterium]
MQAIVEHFFEGFSGSGVSDLKLHIMINATTPGFMDSVRQGLATLKPRNITRIRDEGCFSAPSKTR